MSSLDLHNYTVRATKLISVDNNAEHRNRLTCTSSN